MSRRIVRGSTLSSFGLLVSDSTGLEPCRSFSSHRLLSRHAVTFYKVMIYAEFARFGHPVAIIQSTFRNIFISNAIRHFFRIFRLYSRHAITLWQIKSYGVFSGPGDYSVDMRKTKRRFDLWQIQNADYRDDTRNSSAHNGLRRKPIRVLRHGAVCARRRHFLVVVPIPSSSR
jgi:hypothetical protein